MHPPINTLDPPLCLPTDWLQAKNTFTEMNIMFTALKAEHSRGVNNSEKSVRRFLGLKKSCTFPWVLGLFCQIFWDFEIWV